MRVRFWGTRGSIARPGPSTLRYGGNTSCVQVETNRGTTIVLDCGTGAYGLGQELLATDTGRGHLLISHTHWDHIQGFPFFGPLFVAGNEWDIYAPAAAGEGLVNTLRGQMEYTYFPVALDQLNATIHYHDLAEGSFEIGEVRVTARYLNHPAVTLGYRIEVGGVVVVYSSDHEPHSRHQAEPELPRTGATPTLIHAEDERHAEFLAEADLVIHDAQYTAAEYEKKVGWGHSTVEYVVDSAIAGRVKQLALFHHDPLRDDAAVDEVLAGTQRRVAAWGSQLDVFAAGEGQTIEFSEAQDRSTKADFPTVLVVDDDPSVVTALTLVLETEGYRPITAFDGRKALEVARSEHPDLILLDLALPGMDGLDVCRALRADADPQVSRVPVVMLTARGGSADTRAGFSAGANDYLTKPFTLPHVLVRIREWLLRARAA